MEGPCEDTMPELSESLRTLAESGVAWARLIGKFYKPPVIPPTSQEQGESQQGHTTAFL